jgi:hypothetical protein
MSDGKSYSIDKDLAGRLMSLEQRMKGLQGRTAAIEARLSGPGSSSVDGIPASCADNYSDDFVPASATCPKDVDDQRDEPEPGRQSNGTIRVPEASNKQRHARKAVDTTGLIAGVILVGAGILLYFGNFEIIRNPAVALGCGILLLGSVLVRTII